jgi:hypothetical protein
MYCICKLTSFKHSTMIINTIKNELLTIFVSLRIIVFPVILDVNQPFHSDFLEYGPSTSALLA